MLATCWQYAGNMLATCWQHAGNMLTTCWQHADNMLATCCQHAGNILSTCCQHTGNMLATCWQHASNMLATCWKHAENNKAFFCYNWKPFRKLSSVLLCPPLSSVSPYSVLLGAQLGPIRAKNSYCGNFCTSKCLGSAVVKFVLMINTHMVIRVNW